MPCYCCVLTKPTSELNGQVEVGGSSHDDGVGERV